MTAITVNDEEFELLVKEVIKNEGGYVNDPVDPGGETKYGISKRSFPHLDIKNLTIEDAMAIYYEGYYDKYHLDRIKDLKLRYKIFDLSVNVGPGRACHFVSNALDDVGGSGVPLNGTISLGMIESINSVDPNFFLQFLIKEATNFYLAIIESKPKMKKYEKGWLRRAEHVPSCL